MRNSKLIIAKQLIQEKNYEAARSLLETLPDDAIAQKWLRKLNDLRPPFKPPVKVAIQEHVPPPPEWAFRDNPSPVQSAQKPSSGSRSWLTVVIVIGLIVSGIWLFKHNADYQRWQSQSPESKATLSVFCFIHVRQNSVLCDQWAAKVVNDDVSKTDDIRLCNGLYNTTFAYGSTDTYASLFISCLADKGIYLPIGM